MKKTLTLTAFVIFNTNVFSSEIDSFHHRFDTLKDSTDQINPNSNKLFDSVLDKTNKTDNRCDELSLYKNLRKEFHNDVFGSFNAYINNSSSWKELK